MTGMPFEYAVLRIVPRVDRGEYVNGAVLLYCQQAGFLGMQVRADLSCVTALWAKADVVAIADALAAAKAVADGSSNAGEAGLADPGRPVPLVDRAAQRGDPTRACAHRGDRGPPERAGVDRRGDAGLSRGGWRAVWRWSLPAGPGASAGSAAP